MKVEGVYVNTVGAYLPDTKATVEQAVADGLYDAENAQLTGLTGVHVAGDLPAADMAVKAARQAIDRSGHGHDEIDSVIHSGVFCQGPEGWAPSGYIMRELGIGNVPSLEVRNGCNGMLASMEIAIGHLRAPASRTTALLTAAENFSTPMFDRWTGLGPAHIAGDGAAAMLLSTEGGFAEVRCINSGTVPELEGWQRGTESLLPPRDDSLQRWDAVQRGTEFEKEMSFEQVFEYITKFSVDLVQRALVDAGLNISDITRLVTINNDRRAIEYGMVPMLGLTMEHSVWDFGRAIGHVGACDIVISLNHLAETAQLKAGDHLMLMSAGPGWVGSSAILTVTEPPSWSS